MQSKEREMSNSFQLINQSITLKSFLFCCCVLCLFGGVYACCILLICVLNILRHTIFVFGQTNKIDTSGEGNFFQNNLIYIFILY